MLSGLVPEIEMLVRSLGAAALHIFNIKGCSQETIDRDIFYIFELYWVLNYNELLMYIFIPMSYKILQSFNNLITSNILLVFEGVIELLVENLKILM